MTRRATRRETSRSADEVLGELFVSIDEDGDVIAFGTVDDYQVWSEPPEEADDPGGHGVLLDVRVFCRRTCEGRPWSFERRVELVQIEDLSDEWQPVPAELLDAAKACRDAADACLSARVSIQRGERALAASRTAEVAS